MSDFLQRVADDPQFLWLDDTEYSGALLAGGNIPWCDVGAFVAWRRQAQNLLRSSVGALPLAPLCAAWVMQDPQLRTLMSSKSRVNFPLKSLLASGELRRHLAELLTALRAALSKSPLALVCPSPRAWIEEAFQLAFKQPANVPIGEDEVDAATLHCTDFLRHLSGTGLDTVLLVESAESESTTPEEVEWYRSVLNVGSQYRWSMGLRVPGKRFGGLPASTFDYLIAPHCVAAPCFGADLSDFWSSAPNFANVPKADFRFTLLPVGLKPEVILDSLVQLRS